MWMANHNSSSLDRLRATSSQKHPPTTTQSSRTAAWSTCTWSRMQFLNTSDLIVKKKHVSSCTPTCTADCESSTQTGLLTLASSIQLLLCFSMQHRQTHKRSTEPSTLSSPYHFIIIKNQPAACSLCPISASSAVIGPMDDNLRQFSWWRSMFLVTHVRGWWAHSAQHWHCLPGAHTFDKMLWQLQTSRLTQSSCRSVFYEVAAALWKNWRFVNPQRVSFRLGLLGYKSARICVKRWGCEEQQRLKLFGPPCFSVRWYLTPPDVTVIVFLRSTDIFDALRAQACTVTENTMRSCIFHFLRSCWIINVIRWRSAL